MNPDVFYKFYFMNNQKLIDNSRTTEAKEKISTDLKSLEF
jgi:hypothetical protein